jgi:hypothetical protein
LVFLKNGPPAGGFFVACGARVDRIFAEACGI